MASVLVVCSTMSGNTKVAAEAVAVGARAAASPPARGSPDPGPAPLAAEWTRTGDVSPFSGQF